MFLIDEAVVRLLGFYQWIHVNKRGVGNGRQRISEQAMCRLKNSESAMEFPWHNSCEGPFANRGKRDSD